MFALYENENKNTLLPRKQYGKCIQHTAHVYILKKHICMHCMNEKIYILHCIPLKAYTIQAETYTPTLCVFEEKKGNALEITIALGNHIK